MRSSTVRFLAVTALTAILLAGCGGAPGSDAEAPGQDGPSDLQQPYAGLEARTVKALSPAEVGDLLAGRGAGYALAAELNHYPGPAHALELAEELELTSDQEQAVRTLFQGMQAEAQALGRRLVDLETELDSLFAGGDITADRLEDLAVTIAGVEGQLRFVHLATHLQMKDLLSPEQVARYDALRGYDGTGDDDHGGHGGH